MWANQMSAAEPPGSDLPVHPFLPEIVGRLQAAGILVLSAEPGAGKTSLVPLALAAAFDAGKVIVVEPRRVAAIAAATRLAELAGWALGEDVGYRVKGESRAGASTRIEAVTAGVLIRMLQGDPFLEGVATIVFDEFHERSLDLDLALALAREARSARAAELRLLVMSATLDTEGLAAKLEAPSLSVPGRVFPIETRCATLPPVDPLRWVADAILEATAGGAVSPSLETGRGREMGGRSVSIAPGGDILVFLPGMAEILKVEGYVAGRLAERGIETLRLHSSLPLAEQRRVITAAPSTGSREGVRRRVILSTSIAETSLTVPRVTTVIDCGLARGSRFDRRSGLNRLVTERESADRAEQRRGRAGRLGPGLCLRAWTATEILPERSPPEILRADLSDLVLECLVWGATSRTELRWIDPPPRAAWEDALETLRGLGAVAGEGVRAGVGETAGVGERGGGGESGPAPRVTQRGREMAALGIEVRLGALVIAGRHKEKAAVGEARGDSHREGSRGRGHGTLACIAAAILDRGGAPGGGSTEGGFAERVGQIAQGRDRDPLAATILEEARRIASRAGIRFDAWGVEPELLPGLFAEAWPDRIARRVEFGGTSAVFMLPAGRRIKATLPLAASPWIVALDADAGESLGRLYSGIAIGEAEALEGLAPLLVEDTRIEWKGRGYRARRIRRAGTIELSSTALGVLDPPLLAGALRERLEAEGLSAFFPDAEAEAFLARYRFWGSRPGNEGLPDLEGRGAAASVEEWLLPWIDRDTADILPGTRLRQALEGRLSPELLRRFRVEAPERVELPSGATKELLYDQGPLPLIEGRVHEFYGVGEHPKVAGLPLVIRLLSPAGRPVQVTSDLPGFWKGAWAEARKELRGRYPKHDWPENPALALPSRKGLKPRQT